MKTFDSLEQMKKAVYKGARVHWKNARYTLLRDTLGRYLIECDGHYTGLHEQSYSAADFYAVPFAGPARYFDISNGNAAGATAQEAGDYAARMILAGRNCVLVLDSNPATVDALTVYRKAGTAVYNGTEGTAGNAYAWRDFWAGYLEAAMWADGPRDDETGDVDDNAPDPEGEELAAMARDACAWYAANFGMLSRAADCVGYDWGRAGHDFWLTRCGHGVGYWDRDELPDDIRDALTEASKRAGEAYLYVGDDGKTYIDFPGRYTNKNATEEGAHSG